jgi:hypothetical protein
MQTVNERAVMVAPCWVLVRAVPRFEGCGTSMSEEHSWTPADQLIAYDHCR